MRPRSERYSSIIGEHKWLCRAYLKEIMLTWTETIKPIDKKKLRNVTNLSN